MDIPTLPSLNAALMELQRRRREFEQLLGSLTEPIAVIGASCRLPGGINSLPLLWEALLRGTDSSAPLASSRFAVLEGELSPAERRSLDLVGRASLFEDIDQFDSAFFGISPREARAIDPQHRLLLELAWEALEDAGVSPRLDASTSGGVFIGCSTDAHSAAAEDLDIYSGPGSHASMAAGRVSHKLGWSGPSVAINTACSSSLVAVHLACQSLRGTECDVAIVGGVQLLQHPRMLVVRQLTGALSAGGRCQPFAAEADGFGVGEGGALVVLKRLTDALADGNRILGCILGSAVNHNGTGAGLTVPNPAAQRRVMESALSAARCLADSIDYIESHGTGTALGDAIEMDALGDVFALGERSVPLSVGSVKSNFGHLEAAAGALSLLKVLLGLERSVIPPTLLEGNINPKIDWRGGSLEFARRPVAWERTAQRVRLAGISSFGLSGTNAHVVVGDPPVGSVHTQPERAAPGADEHVFILSARTKDTLSRMARRMVQFLAAHPDVVLADLCWTLANGRMPFRHRLAFPARTTADVTIRLRAIIESDLDTVSYGCAPRDGSPRAASILPREDEPEWFGAIPNLARAVPTEWIDDFDVVFAGPDSGESDPRCVDASSRSPALAACYVRGVDPQWHALVIGPRRSIALPTYPFSHLPDHTTGDPAPDTVSIPGDQQVMEPSSLVGGARHFVTVEQLCSVVADLLEMAPAEVEPDVPLLELGADSVILVEIGHYVEEKAGAKISVRQLFEELQTVRSIADYAAEHQVEVEETPPRGEPLEPAAAPPVTAVASWRPAPLMRREKDNIIAELCAEVQARTRNSRNEASRYRIALCNNRRTLSEIRPEMTPISYPIRARTSAGSRFVDIDGNEYVDIAMGFGVHLFGHNPPFAQEAIRQQLARGTHLGPESDLAGEAAEGILRLVGGERVLFCNTGTEAVMTAMRIARAATGRRKIAIFRNSYHGHYDGTLAMPGRRLSPEGVPIAPGVAAGLVFDVLVLPFDSPQALSLVRLHADDLAGVLVEPVQNRRPDIHPGSFLQALRQLTSELQIPLIFDEVLVGFRIAQGGAQAHFGVRADMVTYAKVIGGGLPIGVVVGDSSLMDSVDGGSSFWLPGDPDPRPSTYTAGTYCKNPLSMATTCATIAHLSKEGPELQQNLNRRTDMLVSHLNAELRALGTPLSLANFGSFFRFAYAGNLSFVHQPLEIDLFNAALLCRGAFVVEGGTCFLSTAHTDEDLERIVDATLKSARYLQSGGLFVPSGHGARPGSAHEGVRAARPTATSPAPIGDSAEPVRVVSERRPGGSAEDQAPRALSLSVSYFGSYAEDLGRAYDLIIDAAVAAEQAGFEALWFPERHFHEFGATSPNPSLLACAISQRTSRIGLRAGSVVGPLHHPIRIAEEWSVVDNLSSGRAGIAFASGWQADDFVLAPSTYADRRAVMRQHLDVVRRLWRGEEVAFENGAGRLAPVRLHPKPVQQNLPMWLAALEHQETFELAGCLGAGVLTNLVRQDVPELTEKISAYRAAWSAAGHLGSGNVVLLLHSLVGDDDEAATKLAREPLRRYLRSGVNLAQRSSRRGGKEHTVGRIAPADEEYMLDRGVDRYISHHSLIGSVASCQDTLVGVSAAGVDSVACMFDFGLSADVVLGSISRITEVVGRLREGPAREVLPSGAQLTAGRATARIRADRPVSSIPATENQKLMWAAANYDGVGHAYEMRTSIEVLGKLDVDALDAAVNDLVNRHEALRSVFVDYGERVEFRDPMPLDIRLLDLTRLNDGQRRQALADYYADPGTPPMDLEAGPLIQVDVLRLAPQEHRIVTRVHHIVYDGISEQILLRELSALYSARLGHQAELPAAPKWSEHAQTLPGDGADESYWRKQLTGLPDASLFGAGKPGDIRHFDGDRMRLTVPEEVRLAVQRVCAQLRCTPYIGVLGMFSLLAHEEFDRDDILIGITAAGRGSRSARELVGYCANLLPVRSSLRRTASVGEHLQYVRQAALSALDHDGLESARILDIWRRDGHAQPMIELCFNWDRIETPELPGARLTVLPDPPGETRFPLSLNVVDIDGTWELECDYGTVDLERGRVEGLLRRLLDRLGRLEDLLDQKIEQATTVVQRIELVGQRYPDRAAVAGPDGVLSYGEFLELSERGAAELRARGVGTGSVVAIQAPAGSRTVAAILAVWRSGAAFAMLDPHQPWERTGRMLRRLRAAVVVADLDLGYPGDVSVISLESLLTSRADAPPSAGAPDGYAYTVFTSGSSGEPKPCGITHAQLTTYIDGVARRMAWESPARFGLVSPLHVDLGYTMLFGALSHGGTVVMPEETTLRNADEFASWMRQSAIDYLKITPGHLAALMEGGPDVLPRRAVVLGGEPLGWPVVAQIREQRNDLEIFNHYGPAETTIGACVFNCGDGTAAHLKEATVPIGAPLDGVVVSIAGDQPSEGELLISGPTVSDGYIDDPAGTAEAFTTDEGGLRWYRTGDLVRGLADGVLVFLGRVDHIFKVRGFRVSPVEIESALRRNEAILDAAVTCEGDVLTAHVVTLSEAMRAEHVIEHVSGILPDHMVPRRIRFIGELPRSASGKLDRRSLAPADPATAEARQEAEDDALLDGALAIWRLVLERDDIGADDDFFDIGGHSIHAIKIVARSKRAFVVEMGIKTMFQNTTPRQFARAIGEAIQKQAGAVSA